MARTLIVSDRHNSFFTANNIRVGNQIPVEGDYVKGDIIVNIGENTATEAMWICVESGNPGIWEVVGAGAGGGSNFVSVNNTVFVNEPVNEVDMGLGFGVTSKDKLIVHHNSVHLMQGVDYRIEGNKIVKLTEGNWNDSGNEEAMFAFELFKNVESVDGNLVELKTKLVCMQNNVVVNGAVNEVKIGIEGFNKDKDTLMVFENETFLTRGVNYEINGNGDGIVPVGDEVWNDVMIDDWSYTFVVFKDVPLVEGEDKIGMDLLADDVKKAIQDASNIDLSGYATKESVEYNQSNISSLQTNVASLQTNVASLQTNVQNKSDNELATNDKTIVGAINELFQSANNGKELIANAIGEPLNAEDTFSAMSTDINSLLSTFKTNMMNNGITVESSDKFKSLIDKIATMVEEGEGKGIQIAEGVCNDITLSMTASRQNFSLGMNIDFTPNIVIVNIKNFRIQYTTYLCNCTVNSLFHNSASNLCYLFGGPNNTAPTGTHMAGDVYITSSNQLSVKNSYYDSETPTLMEISWYAIRIGEEDTTLLDSLKSILEEEGVTTTEEDDMASLIIKVDEEFDRQNEEMNVLEDSVNTLTNEKNDLEEDAEKTRSTLAGLMQEGGYDITGDEDINSLLDLLILSGISVSDIKQIACGDGFTFILKNDGSLWACGYNNYGQLGLGNTTTYNTFTQVTTNVNNDVKQIACGYSYTFILKNDGSIWSCGYNSDGQLGINDANNKTTFTQVTTNINNDVKQISCGYSHTFILKNDGSIWSCGFSYYGQLGLGDTSYINTFTQVTTNINNDVEQIACGRDCTFILKNDGSVWSCGYNYYGQLGLNDFDNRTTFTQVTTNINNDVKFVACGAYHSFILKNDDSVWSCGANGSGQLGLNNTNIKTTFTQVTTNINNDVKQISCGYNHTFISKNDGSIWSCGYNEHYGQLGLGTSDATAHSTFTQVTTNINNDVRQIACGTYHTFILKNDGSVWSCGNNERGQLGLGTSDTNAHSTFTMIPRGLY